MLTKLLFNPKGKNGFFTVIKVIEKEEDSNDELFYIRKVGLNTDCVKTVDLFNKKIYCLKKDVVNAIYTLKSTVVPFTFNFYEAPVSKNLTSLVKAFKNNENMFFRTMIDFAIYLEAINSYAVITANNRYDIVKDISQYTGKNRSSFIKLGRIYYPQFSTNHNSELYYERDTNGSLGYTVEENTSYIDLHNIFHSNFDKELLDITYKVFGLDEWRTEALSCTTYLNHIPKNYTFGVEFETASGFIPKEVCVLLGFVPLRDGSLGNRNSFEYASKIISKPEDFYNLWITTRLLNTICKYNKSCAFHIHVSSTDNKAINLLELAARYKVNYDLQDFMFSLVPNYKKDEITSFGKSKNYSAPLPWPSTVLPWRIKSSKDIENLQNDIVSYLTAYQPKNSIQFRDHKDGPRTPWSRQWRCPTRYHYVNFINYLFSTGTTEYRLPNPTFDVEQVFNWILIVTALYSMKESHYLSVPKVTVEHFLEAFKNLGVTPENILRFEEYVRKMSTYKNEANKTFCREFVGGSSYSNSFSSACHVEVDFKKASPNEKYRILP